MQLSKRMEMLASMVTTGNRLADIGTDHAYIPIFLKQQGKIPSAIAMDVGKGPLLRAKTHISEAGLSQYIETRLSDGLEKLQCNEADTILIAGMGGPLMNRILREHLQVADSAKELVLQPQSEIEETRAFLAENGYRIIQEEMVLEEGKFYPMMRAKKEATYQLSPMELAFGPVLLRDRHSVLKMFLDREQEMCEKLLLRLSAVENPRTQVRKAQVQERLSLIQQAMGLF